MRRFLSRLNLLQVGVVLVVLTLVAFAPFITNSFVSLDDNYLIYKNPAVQHLSWSSIAFVFTHYDPQLYIPVTFLSFQLNALLFGLTATSFHAVNVLIHCVNVVLVLLIIRKLSNNLFVAAVTAALFAIHPIQVETVLWAAARKDLLSGLFFLLATLEYLRFREHPSKKIPVVCLVLFALGLLSKVSIILLPFWLLLIDRLQGRAIEKRALTEKIPFLALSVVFGLVAVVGKETALGSSGRLIHFLIAVKSIAFYPQKILLPYHLSVVYQYSGSVAANAAGFVASGAILAAMAFAMIHCVTRRKSRLVSFGLSTYFLLLLPSMATFWKNGFLFFASDRYVYLAVIGLFLLIAIALTKIKHYAVHAACAIILILIPITWLQASTWKDSIALYENVLSIYPDSVMAHTNIGLDLQYVKRFPEAESHYKRAIELEPHALNAYFNLSSLYAETGRPQEGKDITLKIVDAVSVNMIHSAADLTPLLWLLGKLDRIGHPDEAVRLIEKLRPIAPDYPGLQKAIDDWKAAHPAS